MRKRILSAAVSLALFFTAAQAAAFGAETAETPVPETAVPKGLLYAVGAADQGEDLSGQLTRGEFAGTIINFMQYSAQQGESAHRFSDVDTGHAYNQAINMVYALGYMAGDGDGTFRPDDAVTYPEVLTVVVKALGYGNMLREPAQYAYSYISKAQQLGVALDKADESVNRGEVYRILELALEAPYHPVIGVQADGVVLDSQSSTVLENIYHVYRSRGIVTQNGQTSLYDADGGSGRREQVMVGEQLYYTELPEVGEHLGEEIDFYYRDENQIQTLLYYTTCASTRITELDAGDIEGFSALSLRYSEESGKLREAKISDRANVIYNGTYDKKGYDLSASDFIFSDGSVKLISNGTGEYSTVIIKAYQFGVFDRLTSDEMILLKENPASFALEDYDLVTVTKNGTIQDTPQFAEWDVLNILEDRQKKNLSIEITTQTAEGVLKQITQTEEGRLFTVEDTRYKVNAAYESFNTREEKIGRSDIFLLDKFGQILMIRDETAVVQKYAVILGVGSLDLFGEKLPIRLLNSKDKIKVYDITSTVKVNGKKYSDLSQLSWLVSDPEGWKGKPVRFETNSQDQLTEIYMEAGTGYEEVLDKELDRVSKRWKSSPQFFGGAEVAVRENTAIFVVGDKITDDEDCFVAGMSYLGNDVFYDISAYNYDDYHVADLIIIHEDNTSGGAEKIDADSPLFVSEGLITSLDEEGGTIYQLSGMISGRRSDGEFWIDPHNTAVKAEDFEKGNLLQLKTSSTGEVRAVSLLLDFDPGNTAYYYDSSSILGKVFGRVKRSASDKFLLNVSGSGGEDLRVLKPGGNIYVYDQRQETVSLGSASDIAPDSVLFIRERYQAPQDIVVFRE